MNSVHFILIIIGMAFFFIVICACVITEHDQTRDKIDELIKIIKDTNQQKDD